MDAQAKEANAVEEALAQLTNLDGAVDDKGKPLTALNLNNTSVFRAMSSKQRKEKYVDAPLDVLLPLRFSLCIAWDLSNVCSL